jgi:hypothetical protein
MRIAEYWIHARLNQKFFLIVILSEAKNLGPALHFVQGDRKYFK